MRDKGSVVVSFLLGLLIVSVLGLTTDQIIQNVYDSTNSALRSNVVAGGGGSVGPGTVNKVAKFATTSTIGDSNISDDGTNALVTSIFSQGTGVAAANSIAIGKTAGCISFEGSSADANRTNLCVTNPTSVRTFTLPDSGLNLVNGQGSTGAIGEFYALNQIGNSTITHSGTTLNLGARGDINANVDVIGTDQAGASSMLGQTLRASDTSGGGGNVAGASLTIRAGAGTTTGAGGAISLAGGPSGTGGVGGATTIGGAASVGTDIGAGLTTIKGGIGTGAAVPGAIIMQTGNALASGSTAHTLVDRYDVGVQKVLANNTVTPIVNFTMANNTVVAGNVTYSCQIFNGTDLQIEEGQIAFHETNKANTPANNTVTKYGNQQAMTSGTLTVTWTITAATPAVLSVNCNSSLTPSTGYPILTYAFHNLTNQAAAIQ